MLQDLTRETAAQLWAIGSMFFFIAVYVVVVLITMGKGHDDLERCSHLPLDDDPPMPREDAGTPALTSRQGR